MSHSTSSQPESPRFRVGDWVRVRGMRGPARVVGFDRRGKRIRVELGDQQWLLEPDRLSPAAPPERPAENPASFAMRAASTLRHEVDLHGMRVEDALEIADRELDRAVVNRLTRFKIVHGHGTGALRKAIREMLDRHPHVAGYRFGEPHEGGLACTVVELGSPGGPTPPEA
jgi:DNA mismatch repair protein MutS2